MGNHKWNNDKCTKCKIQRQKSNKYIKDEHGNYQPKRMYEYFNNRFTNGTFKVSGTPRIASNTFSNGRRLPIIDELIIERLAALNTIALEVFDAIPDHVSHKGS